MTTRLHHEHGCDADSVQPEVGGSRASCLGGGLTNNENPDPRQWAVYSAACATGSPSFTPRMAYSAATLIASIMLTALALPVPAISNAVP